MVIQTVAFCLIVTVFIELKLSNLFTRISFVLTKTNTYHIQFADEIFLFRKKFESITTKAFFYKQNDRQPSIG